MDDGSFSPGLNEGSSSDSFDASLSSGDVDLDYLRPLRRRPPPRPSLLLFERTSHTSRAYRRPRSPSRDYADGGAGDKKKKTRSGTTRGERREEYVRQLGIGCSAMASGDFSTALSLFREALEAAQSVAGTREAVDTTVLREKMATCERALRSGEAEAHADEAEVYYASAPASPPASSPPRSPAPAPAPASDFFFPAVTGLDLFTAHCAARDVSRQRFAKMCPEDVRAVVAAKYARLDSSARARWESDAKNK
jgi:hypothetical protein